jgi:hypothetical protein
LVAAVKAVYTNKTPGCSLDKHEQEQWQKSRVDGIEWNNRWAEIMIEADYLMKRISNGHVDAQIAGLESWWDKYIRRAITTTQSGSQATANRWWFNRPEERVESARQLDGQGDIAILYENPVVIMTRELDSSMQHDTGGTTPEATEFASEFSNNMLVLGRKYQSIGQLLALYRVLDLVAHIKELGRVPAQSWNKLMSVYVPIYEGPPPVVPTLGRETSYENGYVSGWARMSGGVRMPVSVDLNQVRKDQISDRLRERLFTQGE